MNYSRSETEAEREVNEVMRQIYNEGYEDGKKNLWPVIEEKIKLEAEIKFKKIFVYCLNLAIFVFAGYVLGYAYSSFLLRDEGKYTTEEVCVEGWSDGKGGLVDGQGCDVYEERVIETETKTREYARVVAFLFALPGFVFARGIPFKRESEKDERRLYKLREIIDKG